MNNPDDITNVEHFVETRTDSHDIAAAVSKHAEVPSSLEKEDGTHSEEDVSGNESEEDDQNVLDEFVQAIDFFKEKVCHAYQSSSLKKGVKFFTKKLRKFTKQTDNSLEKSLFSIGK